MNKSAGRNERRNRRLKKNFDEKMKRKLQAPRRTN
jgi:hypothetical protein